MPVELKSPRSELGYANHLGYSDVNPYEVVGRVGKLGYRVRPMRAERLHEHADLGFEPGGFFGHCANQREGQRWALYSNPEAPEKVVRLCRASKPGGRLAGFYYDKHGARFALSDEPAKFYDFNF